MAVGANALIAISEFAGILQTYWCHAERDEINIGAWQFAVNNSNELFKVLSDSLTRVAQLANVIGTGIKNNASGLVLEHHPLAVVNYLGNGGATKAAVNRTKVGKLSLESCPMSESRTTNKDRRSLSRRMFLIMHFKGTNSLGKAIKVYFSSSGSG